MLYPGTGRRPSKGAAVRFKRELETLGPLEK